MFAIGDHVHYKRNDSKVWHGPCVILGVDSNLALARHGGSYLRASPRHLCKVKDDSQIFRTSVKPSVIMKDCNRHKSGQNKQLDPSPYIAAAIDADEPINADKLQEVIRNDGKIPNDHHST